MSGTGQERVREPDLFVPASTHDDMVDALHQALRFLRDSGWLEIDPPPDDDWDEDDYVDSGRSRRRENPYAQ
jgi:hypothetical protein